MVKTSRPGKRRKPKRTFLERLCLAGFIDITKAESKKERAVWWAIIVVLYASAAYSVFSVIGQQNAGTTAIFIDHGKREAARYETMTVCHTVHWNKTYFEQNVDIPSHIADKLVDLGMTRDELLSEYSQYISLFSVFYDREFRPALWEVLTELFDHNFRNVQFSDFISDAKFRGNTLLRNCRFMGVSYSCSPIGISHDLPSCFFVPIIDKNKTHQYFGSDKGIPNNDRLHHSFEIDLPQKYIFDYPNRDTQDLGVRLSISPTPTPFTDFLYIPANTHVSIEFKFTEFHLKTDCIKEGKLEFFHGWYTYDACLVEAMQKLFLDVCNCYVASGDYYPRNDLVCTPNMTKNCVRTKVIDRVTGNASQVSTMKRTCKRTCHSAVSTTSMTMHNLEDTGDSIRNTFSISPNTERSSVHTEKEVYSVYTLICDIGGVLGVYTAASGAALVQAFVLFANEGCHWINRKILRKILSKFVDGMLPFVVVDAGAKEVKRRRNTIQPMRAAS